VKIGPNHDGCEVFLVDALGADGIAGAIGGRGDGVCAVGTGDVAGAGDVATAGEEEIIGVVAIVGEEEVMFGGAPVAGT